MGWRDALRRIGLMDDPPIAITSRLDPDMILARLGEVLDGEWKVFGERPFIGRVSGQTFRMRKRIGYRNSFQTFMRGTVLPYAGGSRVEARMGLHPFVRIFMVVWLFLVVGIGSAAFPGLVEEASDPTRRLIGLVPVVMIVGFFAMLAIGRWIAREERAALVAFLEETAEAPAVPVAPDR
jgi:hypothetical protein